MNTHGKYELPPLPEPDQYIWYSRGYVEKIRQEAIEADRKRIAKQLSAYESLVASLEAKCTHMRKMYDELKDRTNPELLASERAANAILTAELEAYRKRGGVRVCDDRMPDSMRDFITGMAVSVDVSTCEDDAGHRYFGTVTEVMDASEKHGVILLVQDAEPNFERE